MITNSLQFIEQRFQNRTFFLILIAPLIFINCFAFVASCFRIHDNSSQIFSYIRTLPNKPVIIYYQGESFYYTLADDAKTLSPRFYKDNHKIISKDKNREPASFMSENRNYGDSLVYVVVDPYEPTEKYAGLEMIYKPQPDWISKVNYRNWMHAGSGDWKLYKIKSEAENTKQ